MTRVPCSKSCVNGLNKGVIVSLVCSCRYRVECSIIEIMLCMYSQEHVKLSNYVLNLTYFAGDKNGVT